MNGEEWHGSIYTNIGKIESRWKFAVWLRELKLGFCIKLEEWERVGGGSEFQEGGDMGISMVNSCWYMTESNQYYKAIINQLK